MGKINRLTYSPRCVECTKSEKTTLAIKEINIEGTEPKDEGIGRKECGSEYKWAKARGGKGRWVEYIFDSITSAF